MLSVRELSAGYDGSVVVDRVDLDVEHGEVVALIGANGAGKTTLLRAIAGLHPLVSGEVHLDGRSLTKTSAADVARRGLRLVPSDRRLFPDMTVRENLQLGAHPRRVGQADLSAVVDLFPRIAERWGQRAGTLSGGEQQMVALARALVGRPTLLVLDEPTTGLAPLLAAELYEALAQLRGSSGVTVLVAEQQLPRVLELADRGVVLEHGRVRRQGTAQALRDDPEVRRAYLGVD